MELKPFISCGQVYFGQGTVRSLPAVVRNLSARRILVVTDQGVVNSGIVGEVVSLLRKESIDPVVFAGTKPEPGEETVMSLLDSARGEKIDAVLGLGGGSSLDCAKVASVMIGHGGSLRDYLGANKVATPGAPLVLVPTTSGTGSESTPNALFIVDGEKQAVISPYLIPRAAIIDPELTVSVPPKVTAASGVDALVHACESYTSLKARKLTEMYSLRAVELIGRSIRKAVWQGSDIEARTGMALGSFLAGIAIANAGTGAVHALAYPLGLRFGLSHGVSNSVMFSYVSQYNVAADPAKFAILAQALGERVDGLSVREAALSFVTAIRTIVEDLGLPAGLAELGVAPSDAEPLALDAVKQTRLLQNNPRPLSHTDILSVYQRAIGCS